MKHARAKGMSLVELLVALMLGALLMGLLNAVLNNVQAGWRKATAIAIASTEELALAQFLFASVAAALPPEPLDKNTWFLGNAERIEFLAAGPAADAGSGPLRVLLYLLPQKDGRKALMVEMRPLTHPSGFIAGAAAHVLADGLASLSFDFSEASGQRLSARTSWDDPRTLPQVIGVNIVFIAGRAKPLRLAMSPRRTVSGRCVFDLVSLSCRA